jgi:hypothetical protein
MKTIARILIAIIATVFFLMVLHSCSPRTQSTSTLADFVITRVSECDTVCVKERGILRIDSRNITFISASYDIRLSSIHVIAPNEFTAIDQNNKPYDVVIGKPMRGDAIIGFQPCHHEWIIIDTKCFGV